MVEQSEDNTFYNLDPENFAIKATSETIFIIGSEVGLNWFMRFKEPTERQLIIKTILQQSVSKFKLNQQLE